MLIYVYAKYSIKNIPKEVRRSGYVDTFTENTHVFYKDCFFKLEKFEIKIKRSILHTEDVPDDVMIEIGTFGEQFGWKTSCPPDIFQKCSNKVTEVI